MMGGYDGGRAEFVRVPFANTGAQKIPDNLKEEQALFLSDMLCTRYFGADMANVQPGDHVAVFGAGPIGYFATMSAFLRGPQGSLQLTTGRRGLTRSPSSGPCR